MTSQEINKLTNVLNNINRNTDKIIVISDITSDGDINVQIEKILNDFAKYNNIDPKKVNFVFAYLGQTNNITGKLQLSSPCPTCKSSTCPSCQPCPSCPLYQQPPKITYKYTTTFYIIIFIIICVIILSVWLFFR